VLALTHRLGHDLAKLKRGAAGRIFLEAVVPLDDFDVDARRIIAKHAAGGFSELHHEVDGSAHAGGDDDRELAGRLGDKLALFCFKPGGGDHQRLAKLEAMRDHGNRRVGDGEVDHNVGLVFADDGQWHAKLAHAGDEPGVLAKLRVTGRLQRSDDLNVHILAAERHHALPHASGGPVYCNLSWHPLYPVELHRRPPPRYPRVHRILKIAHTRKRK
jgi:hypothetical protein